VAHPTPINLNERRFVTSSDALGETTGLFLRLPIQRKLNAVGKQCLDGKLHACAALTADASCIGRTSRPIPPCPYTRKFRASLRRIADMPDSSAERAGFELTGDFVAAQ
jgi:hypothetical protein